MAPQPKKNGRDGFTLIQISILLTVAGLVMVAVLPSLQTALQSNSISSSRMNAIFTAMRQYEAANGDLPCPADATQAIGNTSYGVAAANGGSTTNCTGGTPAANFVDPTYHVATGMVPVRALGLPNSYAVDGFGRDVTYAVDTSATSCWSSTTLTGNITVADNGSYNTTVAALVSHGADGHGAWLPLTGASGTAKRLNAGSTDTDQLVNAHLTSGFANAASSFLAWSGSGADTTFVNKPATATFDDLVVYSSPLWNINKLPLLAPGGSAPTVTAPSNGTYVVGNTLTFTLTFSSATTVNTTGGTPYITLAAVGYGSNGIGIGTSNVAKATYTGGTGTTALTFQYTVQSSDYAPQGITMASTITLNGGIISPCIGSFTAPGLTGVHLNYAIYVADAGHAHIAVYNSSGTWILSIGGTSSACTSCGCTSGTCPSSAGSGTGQLSDPNDVAVDSSGNVWVADTGNNRIDEYSSNGTYLLSIGSGYQGVGGTKNATGTGNGQFKGPQGVTVDSSNNVWVADSANGRIQEFNSSGAYQGKFTTTGTWPTSLRFDSTGSNLWISDASKYLEEYTTSGSLEGSYGHSLGVKFDYVAIDATGNIWTDSYSSEHLYEFSSTTGTLLGTYGAGGTGNGDFSTDGSSPEGLAFDPNGTLWVSDTGNARIEKWSDSGTFQSNFATSGNGVVNAPYGMYISAYR